MATNKLKKEVADVTLSVRITPTIEKQILAFAKKNDISKGETVRFLLIKALDTK